MIKMNKYVIFVLSLNLHLAFFYRHEKPVAESIWRERCNKHSMILNDCNWCRCTDQHQYVCDARVCRDVDMFGHFTDTIKDIDVGMKGHGSWRSGQTACEPGVHYQRGDLLCVCTEDGGWPNPICRDTFRVLHPVEIVTDVKAFKYQECKPATLCLIGCNVCFCPADGVPNPKFCTRETCSKDDPVFNTPTERTEVNEVYVQCDLDSKYKLGCKNCICLRNNRLLCDNCTSTTSGETVCSNRKPGEMFNIDCNMCQCDEQGYVYCTVKRCHKNYILTRESIVQSNFELKNAPMIDIDCVPGTMYRKDCNTCFCFKSFGVKKYACTLEKCSEFSFHTDCVNGSMYDMDCLLCQCANYNGKKMQICQENPKCSKPIDRELMQLSDLSGYCEPLHIYKKGCNTCQCLADGKTVRCTAKLCQNNSLVENEYIIQKPILVEIVPVVKDIGSCVKGSTFKIDCNLCFCLMNGDVICTTEKCR